MRSPELYEQPSIDVHIEYISYRSVPLGLVKYSTELATALNVERTQLPPGVRL